VFLFILPHDDKMFTSGNNKGKARMEKIKGNKKEWLIVKNTID